MHGTDVPEVIEPVAVVDTAGLVEIAAIEAKRDVKIAEIDLERSQTSDLDRIFALERELEELRASSAGPAVVVIDQGEPDPIDDPAAVIPDMVPVDLDAEVADGPDSDPAPAPKKEKKAGGWW